MKKTYVIGEDKKISVSNGVILLLSVYMAWQMGVMFYSGTSLSLYGRTPVPIEGVFTTLVIALGYIVTLAVHFALARYTLVIAKAVLAVALAATVMLFFPLPQTVLAGAFYVTAFCCTFFIGTTYSVEVGFYNNECVLRSNFLGTIFGVLLIAVLQNDFFKLSFSVFNAISVVLLVALFVGYSLLPAYVETPRITVRQAKTQQKLPVWLFAGLYVSPFVSTLLLVFSSSVAETVENGVFVMYVLGAVFAAVWFILYKKLKVSPFKISTVSFAFSIAGFTLAALSMLYPPLVYPAIVLMSSNLLVANMFGFFGNTAFFYRPTRFVGSGIVLIGLVVALLQAGLLELLRDNLTLLFAIMSVLSVLAILFYILVEPSLTYRFRELQKKTASPPEETTANDAPAEASAQAFSGLSVRDRQIVELILQGYTVPEIAKTLYYSEESVKTYKKNIYAELDVHSKRELFILSNKKAEVK